MRRNVLFFFVKFGNSWRFVIGIITQHGHSFIVFTFCQLWSGPGDVVGYFVDSASRSSSEEGWTAHCFRRVFMWSLSRFLRQTLILPALGNRGFVGETSLDYLLHQVQMLFGKEHLKAGCSYLVIRGTSSGFWHTLCMGSRHLSRIAEWTDTLVSRNCQEDPAFEPTEDIWPQKKQELHVLVYIAF